MAEIQSDVSITSVVDMLPGLSNWAEQPETIQTPAGYICSNECTIATAAGDNTPSKTYSILGSLAEGNKLVLVAPRTVTHVTLTSTDLGGP
jgi:hypothetical protein